MARIFFCRIGGDVLADDELAIVVGKIARAAFVLRRASCKLSRSFDNSLAACWRRRLSALVISPAAPVAEFKIRISCHRAVELLKTCSRIFGEKTFHVSAFDVERAARIVEILCRMLAREAVHEVTSVFRMAENVRVEEGERVALLVFGAFGRASAVPIPAAVWNDDSRRARAVLVVTETVFALDEALAVDVALVPALVNALVAVTVRSRDDDVVVEIAFDRVLCGLRIATRHVDCCSEEHAFVTFWLKKLERLQQRHVGSAIEDA